MERLAKTLLLLLLLPSLAWGVVSISGGVAAPELACGETAWASQETTNLTYAGDFDQGLSSSGVTVCRVDIWCGNSGGVTAHYTLGVFSAANGTGTQYGTTQEWTETMGTAAHWHTIEFATNQPAPSGAFHVYVTQDGDGYFGYNSAGGYDSTDYYLSSNGTPYTNYDMTFRIFVME